MNIGKYKIVWRGFKKDRLFPFWAYKVVPGFKHISEYAKENLHVSDIYMPNNPNSKVKWLRYKELPPSTEPMQTMLDAGMLTDPPEGRIG